MPLVPTWIGLNDWQFDAGKTIDHGPFYLSNTNVQRKRSMRKSLRLISQQALLRLLCLMIVALSLGADAADLFHDSAESHSQDRKSVV